MSQKVQQLELKKEIALLLEELEKRNKYNKISTLFPDEGPLKRDLYAKHVDFMNKGAEFPQRAFIAANRVGKTFSGAYEVSLHLTGDYPSWWKGKRFNKPILAWVAGVTNETTRDVLQKELLGDLSDIGTGMVPKKCIDSSSIIKKQNSGGAVDSVKIKHKSGGYSIVRFKTYEQGREKFQADKVQVIWLDEEPRDAGIFSECVTRTADPNSNDGDGIILLTFTPLFGISDVVGSFLHEGIVPKDGRNPANEYTYTVSVQWDDVPHLSESWKKQAMAAYKPGEREARTKGVPWLGAGAIYTTPESQFVVEPFVIPFDWPRCYGLDVGWNKTAAVFAAKDPNTATWYIFKEHYVGEQHPALHASAIKAVGDWLAGAVDPASNNRNQIDGKRMLELYWAEGLTLYPADNSVDSGINLVHQMLESGQLKIFETCRNWLAEYRAYHRDENGKIVKKKDHLMDATRYLAMSGLELARVNPAIFEEDEILIDNRSGRNEVTGY